MIDSRSAAPSPGLAEEHPTAAAELVIILLPYAFSEPILCCDRSDAARRGR